MQTLDSTDFDAAITESYVSDVVLLSSWLNGKESNTSRPLHRDKTHTGLSTLTHLSTILTIGNHSAPKAHNVHAVIGILHHDRIQCLVFTENAGVNTDNPVTPSGEMEGPTGNSGGSSEVAKAGPMDLQCVPLAEPDPDHGKRLLEQWDDPK